VEIEASRGEDNLNTNIYCNKLVETSDLKIFPECFRGSLKTLWRATIGPAGVICLHLAYSLV